MGVDLTWNIAFIKIVLLVLIQFCWYLGCHLYKTAGLEVVEMKSDRTQSCDLVLDFFKYAEKNPKFPL